MRTVYTEEIELNAEEMEVVIAPLAQNHNEAVEVDLRVEEVEEVVAPALSPNHNEAVEIELNAEEMETVVAPGLGTNHNETLVGEAR